MHSRLKWIQGKTLHKLLFGVSDITSVLLTKSKIFKISRNFGRIIYSEPMWDIHRLSITWCRRIKKLHSYRMNCQGRRPEMNHSRSFKALNFSSTNTYPFFENFFLQELIYTRIRATRTRNSTRILFSRNYKIMTDRRKLAPIKLSFWTSRIPFFTEESQRTWERALDNQFKETLTWKLSGLRSKLRRLRFTVGGY